MSIYPPQLNGTGDSLPIQLASGLRDAFGRMRTSNPQTLFDSKQIHNNQPLFWDDSEVSGSGTTSTHSVARASSTLAVSANTAGKRVRQTFQRFNYQPGKSQLILMTGIPMKSGGGTGIIAGSGYGDDNNGIFAVHDEGTFKFIQRSKVSGSAVDTEVAQSSWNGDKMDGTGDSGHTLDGSKAQIFWIDLEWLGVGSVRCGFVVDGVFILCHQFNNANNLGSVYMSTPNLPVRYWIENDGTGAASEMEQVCASVISEGGIQANGILRYETTGGTHIDANTANTLYACIGLRLKAAEIDEQVDLVSFSMLAETDNDFEWQMVFNPTVAGTFTYSDVPNGSCQTAIGATANTVTGGTVISGGFTNAAKQAGASASDDLDNALRLGVAIDGTLDEVVLCVRPLSDNADIQASLTWREVS